MPSVALRLSSRDRLEASCSQACAFELFASRLSPSSLELLSLELSTRLPKYPSFLPSGGLHSTAFGFPPAASFRPPRSFVLSGLRLRALCLLASALEAFRLLSLRAFLSFTEVSEFLTLTVAFEAVAFGFPPASFSRTAPRFSALRLASSSFLPGGFRLRASVNRYVCLAPERPACAFFPVAF